MTRGFRRRSPRKPVDVMYVAAGTTAGLRQADVEMLGALREHGLDVLTITPSFRTPRLISRYAQRSLLTIDALEAFALRRAAVDALRSHAPRAIIYSTSHAAMLAPRMSARSRVGIRFDTPAQMSRSGAPYRVEYLLERRRFRQARVLMPWALDLEPDTARVLPPETPVIPIPIPIDLDGPPEGASRDPIVVFYGASPHKKGLDVAVRAWARASTAGRRLVVTGIDRDRGLRYLNEHGIEEPTAVEWAGLLPPSLHRDLTRRAEVYLAASRYENYGIGPLEALADGAALVTTPSPGPFAALPIARELDPRLVAERDTPDALAGALESAFAREQGERVTYRGRARELLRVFSREETSRRLRQEVLPLLLGQT